MEEIRDDHPYKKAIEEMRALRKSYIHTKTIGCPACDASLELQSINPIPDDIRVVCCDRR